MAGAHLIHILILLAVPYEGEMTAPAEILIKAEKGKPVILKMVREENRGGVKALIYVRKPIKYVWERLRDVKSFPEFMPDLKKVEVLKKSKHSEIVKFTAEKVFKFSYIIKRNYDRSHMVIWWRSADERFEKIDGFWRLFPWKGGTVLLYFTWLKPKFPVPEFIVRYLTRQSLPGMLKAVKRELEGSGKGIEQSNDIPF